MVNRKIVELRIPGDVFEILEERSEKFYISPNCYIMFKILCKNPQFFAIYNRLRKDIAKVPEGHRFKLSDFDSFKAARDADERLLLAHQVRYCQKELGLLPSTKINGNRHYRKIKPVDPSLTRKPRRKSVLLLLTMDMDKFGSTLNMAGELNIHPSRFVELMVRDYLELPEGLKFLEKTRQRLIKDVAAQDPRQVFSLYECKALFDKPLWTRQTLSKWFRVHCEEFGCNMVKGSEGKALYKKP